MSAKRELTMRQIRQILRLAGDGTSAREIGRVLGCAQYDPGQPKAGKGGGLGGGGGGGGGGRADRCVYQKQGCLPAVATRKG